MCKICIYFLKLLDILLKKLMEVYEAIKSNIYLKVNKFFISYLYFVTNFLDAYTFTFISFYFILFLFVDHFFYSYREKSSHLVLFK